MSDLPLRLWHNGVDFVFARSAEEASILVMDHYGCDAEEAEGDGWETWPEHKPFTLTNLEPGPGEYNSVTKPVDLWIADQKGKSGYFASTEY